MKTAERIEKEMIQAMKDKDALKVSTLRLLKAAMKNREIEKRVPLEEGEVVKTIQSLIKQRQEAAEQYRQGKREDLAGKEEEEIRLLQAYLPQMLDEAAIDKVVQAVISELKVSGPKEMGRVMKEVMSRLAGQPVEGKKVSDCVKKRLNP